MRKIFFRWVFSMNNNLSKMKQIEIYTEVAKHSIKPI